MLNSRPLGNKREVKNTTSSMSKNQLCATTVESYHDFNNQIIIINRESYLKRMEGFIFINY